jgi:hypothetical protein
MVRVRGLHPRLFTFNPCGIEMGDEIAQLQTPRGIETSAVTVLAGRIPGKACSFVKMRPHHAKMRNHCPPCRVCDIDVGFEASAAEKHRKPQ